jgi:hypothetical protein
MMRLSSESLRDTCSGNTVEAKRLDFGAEIRRAQETGCPADFHEIVSKWAGQDLQCRAGRREFNLDRYSIVSIRDGSGLRKAVDKFLALVRQHEKTGLLTIVGGPVSQATTVREELALLADLISEAGFANSAEEALAGKEICLPVDMLCPVTGQETVYSFFPVTFCRNAAQVSDELYDVSLSCPWTAINTTSDAFAFALMVRDRSRRLCKCDPFGISDPEVLRSLFDWAIAAWQNMSVGTISAFAQLSERPDRAVGLSPDARYWTAAHRDPVFAELSKEQYVHEMPAIYARSLADKWFGTLSGGELFSAGREGQAGGSRISESAKVSYELQRFSFG